MATGINAIYHSPFHILQIALEPFQQIKQNFY